MDVLTPEQRQKNMKAIRSRGTKPERILGRGLHARGFRYRLNVARLPGSPDLVFAKHSAVIFAHGCFWHGHNCHLFKIPSTRRDFWLAKIKANAARDQRDADALVNLQWRVMTVWECALRGRRKQPLDFVLDKCAAFLTGDHQRDEIKNLSDQDTITNPLA
ncbi:very short patch repair endonuclease [Ruegeria sp. 2012CJ41-6]|uniref:Very short patch repair endonuclease n=1 Tax=Ruegeria spongiae TaxID=2942209 RepID=A0ABT0Q2T9_9RHOB|nr:very short patch repair endonuclease [Ruegeria spongiae]MCL6284118.1 very short patch repair endonuclease [Ruegeria spongiae]